MHTRGESRAPVLEESSIRQLAADTGYASARSFAETFLSMLPGRVGRILRSLAESDTNSALDAVLSLKVSSSMAGALEMEHLCRDLEDELRGGRMPAGARLCTNQCRLENALKDLNSGH